MSDRDAVPTTPVFGIDLGTTNTCIARMAEGMRKPEVMVNLGGHQTTPSVVYFESRERMIVGDEARNVARAMPHLVCSHIKREMDTDVKKTYHGEDYTPSTISALILRKVIGDALEGMELPRTQRVKAVITVPANYPGEAKNATLQAGVLADVDVLYLAQEPVAAAFAYGFGAVNRPQHLLVYDLGGGTFDATIVRSDGASAHTIATAGEQQCGGFDWDSVIVDWLRQRFEEAHPGNTLPVDDPQLSQTIYEAAEKAKHSLSQFEKTTITVYHQGNGITPELTRAEFEEITSHLLDKTLAKTSEVIEAARSKGVEKIDKVLLVGGSSRMPAVMVKLQEALGQAPVLHEPDLAIAKGAAHLAHLIETGRFKPDMTGKAAAPGKGALVTMVNPKSLGLEVHSQERDKDYVFYLIPRNTEIPAGRTETFALQVDNQESVTLRVFEERAEPSEEIEENTLLHSTPIDLPPGLAKGAPIEVTFRLDSVGFVHIFIKEPKSGQTWEVQVERYKQVSKAEILQLKPKIAKVA
jgi:molecular chaperone DnaK